MYVERDTDCLCGYATGKTDSCCQQECSNYRVREIKMANIELEEKIENATKEFIRRLEAILTN